MRPGIWRILFTTFSSEKGLIESKWSASKAKKREQLTQVGDHFMEDVTFSWVWKDDCYINRQILCRVRVDMQRRHAAQQAIRETSPGMTETRGCRKKRWAGSWKGREMPEMVHLNFILIPLIGCLVRSVLGLRLQRQMRDTADPAARRGHVRLLSRGMT